MWPLIGKREIVDGHLEKTWHTQMDLNCHLVSTEFALYPLQPVVYIDWKLIQCARYRVFTGSAYAEGGLNKRAPEHYFLQCLQLYFPVHWLFGKAVMWCHWCAFCELSFWRCTIYILFSFVCQYKNETFFKYFESNCFLCPINEMDFVHRMVLAKKIGHLDTFFYC